MQRIVTRRRLLLATGTLAALGCIVLVLLLILLPRTGVSKANFDRIETGMTESEVEAIFGMKGKPYSGRMKGFCYYSDGDQKPCAVIQFADGTVAARIWPNSWANHLQAETIFDKVCGWLPWRKQLVPDLNIPLRNSQFNFTTPQFGGYQPEVGDCPLEGSFLPPPPAFPGEGPYPANSFAVGVVKD